MTDTDIPVTEDELHAYVDGELPADRRAAVDAWIAAHPKETQALTDAMVATLTWIHSHSAEDIMAKMPANLVGADKDAYLAALKNTIPMYSTTGLMDPKGAQAVLDVFSVGSPDVVNAKIDISKTYTNDFVQKAGSK